MARLDRRAVDDPDDDRRYLIGGDCDHRLIEEGDTPIDLAEVDEGVALAQPAKRREIAVAEAVRDPGASSNAARDSVAWPWSRPCTAPGRRT